MGSGARLRSPEAASRRRRDDALRRLARARVLWRRPDTLALYAIPHAMRPGQSPRDLVAAEWPSIAWPPGPPIKQAGEVPADWFWIGSPGWWGGLSPEAIEAIREWLAPLEAAGLVPLGPGEWAQVPEGAGR